MSAPGREKGYTFAFYPCTRGGHTHVRVFAGSMGCTRGKAGDLCFQTDEWANLKTALNSTQSSWREIIIRPEEEEEVKNV